MREPRLGDRVRIQLGERPDSLDWWKGIWLACGGRVLGHVPQHEGRVGTVSECSGGFPCKYGSRIGHGYVVKYDQPWVFHGTEFWGGHFAKCELEPEEAPRTERISDKQNAA